MRTKYIWNDGQIPSEFNSTEKLFEKHSSKPYNPKLANVFFKGGMIEAWGRGVDKIKKACAKYAGRLPEYSISASGIMVLCKACDKYLELLDGNESNSLTPDARIMSELMSGKHLIYYYVQDEQDYNKWWERENARREAEEH